MVGRNLTNQSHDNANNQVVKPCLKRFFRQLVFIPWTYRKIFNNTAKGQIRQAVAQAELGHAGEIRVVIEGHLPLSQAHRQNVRDRAIDLFSNLRVWDTEYNSGVLLYINLCERKVELVTDRGIDHYVQSEFWHSICQYLILKIHEQEFINGIVDAVIQLGDLLRRYQHSKHQVEIAKNELANTPVIDI